MKPSNNKTIRFSKNTVHSDIQIERYRQLLELIKSNNYSVCKYNNYKNIKKTFIFRHDIDVDLELALEFAHIESEYNCHSNYFIMIRNEIYNSLSKTSKKIIREIKSLNHDIALHFDANFYDQVCDKGIMKLIRCEAQILEDIVGDSVHFFSFHQPHRILIEKDYDKYGIKSVYNDEFIKNMRYISDSCGRFREESIFELVKKNEPRINFLSHPILWFGSPGETLQNRLANYLNRRKNYMDEQLRLALNNLESGAILYE